MKKYNTEVHAENWFDEGAFPRVWLTNRFPAGLILYVDKNIFWYSIYVCGAQLIYKTKKTNLNL